MLKTLACLAIALSLFLVETQSRAEELDTNIDEVPSESTDANCMNICLERNEDPYDCQESCVQVVKLESDKRIACR